MGLLATIVAAISSDVVAKLAAASYPPLTDGKILVGRAEQYAQSAPSRIIFTPMGSKFAQRDIYSKATALDAAERKRQAVQRAIAQEAFNFEVRCWGAAVPVAPFDPCDDFDVTRALYHQIRATVHDVAPGSYLLDEAGKWTDATFDSSQVIRYGREFVFGLTFFTPVLESLLPYDRTRQYAPDDTVATPTSILQLPTGASNVGCTG